MNTVALLMLMIAAGGDAATRANQVHFHKDIVPILTMAGCNGGGCHGAAAGRGGFHLSLYGSDPAVDYQSIVQQMKGRRVNMARPAESLLLLKPTGQIDHEGGFRFEDDSRSAKILEQWIAQGAEQGRVAKIISFDVQPRTHQFHKLQQTQQLKAIAHFADGTSRDVTTWTVFNSSDPSALAIDDRNVMTIKRRGWHTVTARFLDQVVAIESILPWREENGGPKTRVRNNFIDDRIHLRLDALQLPTSDRASDQQFLRRLFLDLTGRLPTPEQLRRFTSDRRADKDRVLIDELIETEAFVEYWTYWTANLLRIHSASPDKTGIGVYHDWVKKQWQKATPYDELVRNLVMSTGDSHELGPPNFYRTAGDARGQAELVSELFMGVRLRCANCHDHPLDRWKQDDYHGLAAIFAKVERGRVIKIGLSGEVTHPRTGNAAIARIPGQDFLADKANHREILANWITASDNPYFSKAITNRLWKHFMGRGLVEPVEDIRDTNPPTHPELLDELATHFSENKFDLRMTMRLICNSATYRRSSVANKENRNDTFFYSHMPAKPLSAEVLADIIADVSGQPNIYKDQPVGTRAIQLVDSSTPSKSLDLLGRCSRTESCESAAAASGLSRQLHLINGPLINAKLRSPDGRLQRMFGMKISRAQWVREWYYRCLCRLPTTDELNYWIDQFDNTRNNHEYMEAAEDFVWSLLVCEEFASNR
ncbi:MAG: hypothetical protein ACI9HK_000466 [Pirellulaceae bacterium]